MNARSGNPFIAPQLLSRHSRGQWYPSHSKRTRGGANRDQQGSGEESVQTGGCMIWVSQRGCFRRFPVRQLFVAVCSSFPKSSGILSASAVILGSNLEEKRKKEILYTLLDSLYITSMKETGSLLYADDYSLIFTIRYRDVGRKTADNCNGGKPILCTAFRYGVDVIVNAVSDVGQHYSATEAKIKSFEETLFGRQAWLQIPIFDGEDDVKDIMMDRCYWWIEGEDFESDEKGDVCIPQKLLSLSRGMVF
ncbi:hypothetical protein BDV93DRAFT_548015 [Ceratobasidium sp. AG-I]|nr:hypothetical protein BDV93DRAFT_548015 [Ceratobasidium sp. AG-I]